MMPVQAKSPIVLRRKLVMHSNRQSNTLVAEAWELWNGMNNSERQDLLTLISLQHEDYFIQGRYMPAAR